MLLEGYILKFSKADKSVYMGYLTNFCLLILVWVLKPSLYHSATVAPSFSHFNNLQASFILDLTVHKSHHSHVSHLTILDMIKGYQEFPWVPTWEPIMKYLIRTIRGSPQRLCDYDYSILKVMLVAINVIWAWKLAKQWCYNLYFGSWLPE